MSARIEDILKNEALSESAVAFRKWPPMRLGMVQKAKFAPEDPRSGYEVRTDGEVLENGDAIFRLYAPDANTVRVSVGKFDHKTDIELTRRDDGVFEGTLYHDQGFYGYQDVRFFVNGAEVINPHMQVTANWRRLFNYIELPDPEAPYILLNDVPHGSVNRELYFCKTVGEWQRCLVYTPPGYHEGGEYPVVYLQDAANGSELNWMYGRKVPYILDNLIAEGKCVPMIAVVNDPMIQMTHEVGLIDGFDGITGALTQDCREFIESRYHVKKDKWSRAIAGFALGSMQAISLAFTYPEYYAYVGLFSGDMRCWVNHPTFDENPYLELCKDPEKLDMNFKLFFRAMGDKDNHFYLFSEDDEFCAKYGVDQARCYCRKVYEGQVHDINCSRRQFYDFAQMLFR